MLQVDGISFIEHLSYDNLNEGSADLMAGTKVSYAIYATNANRKYCTENKIATSFVAKGN